MAPIPKPVSHVVLAIWQAYEAKAYSGDNLGVGMGQAANECSRAIWYALRWAAPLGKTDGQRQRRFDTGNMEEERLLNDLEAAGVTVERVDPESGRQFRVALADGWLRGKMDGKALNLPEAPKTWHVVETKSHNDKSFKEVQKKKLKDGKPDHYVQCQLYMHASHLKRCLYLAVNKNDDSIYAERIEYDYAFCAKIEAKVKKVVQASKAPPKLFEDPDARAAFQCGWCPAKALCHEGAWARTNCRTCIESELLPNAVVHCNLHNKDLDYDAQQKGCSDHIYLPSLVPGEQIDSDENDRIVVYKLKDGSEWIDGSKT